MVWEHFVIPNDISKNPFRTAQKYGQSGFDKETVAQLARGVDRLGDIAAVGPGAIQVGGHLIDDISSLNAALFLNLILPS